MRTALDDILAPHLAGYESRPGQQQMADAVRETVEGGGRLIVEAGTGTGKSFAYLVPLAEHVLAEETRAVVSTYTKALQRQLIEKDLPLLKEKVFGPLRFALCLGSDNYLCLRRLEQARSHGLFDGDTGDVEALIEWAAATESGIREGQGAALWRKVSRESDICFGKDCRHHEGCFYQRAKALERRSHILVVNHHLYFANLASALRVLPSFDMAVFDEAHELEDVAADYLGLEVSNVRARHLFNSILSARGRGLLVRLKWLEPSDFANISAALNTVRMAAEKFFDELSSRMPSQTFRVRKKGFMEDTLSEHLLRLYRELDGLRNVSGDEEERKELAAVAARTEALAGAVRGILGQELEGHVYWAESSGRALRLAATPVDVAGMDVFDSLDAAVFTSATLSAGGSFDYIKGRLGLEGADELLLKSHFDYREQARLYVAPDLPAPGTKEFEEKVIERVGDILGITGGRTLVLFTSYSLLGRAYDSIQIDGLTLVRQGEADSYRIIEGFRRGESSAIFGTYTFWQGIDVPGEALECVVITKLPFAVPDEPVVEARMELLEKQGKHPFTHYQVPQAAILLKQGFGRLIRRETDRGVVAILDPRIITRSYGRYFLRSLPEAGMTRGLEDIRDFLGRGNGQPGESRTATGVEIRQRGRG
jgi:ATP-dependent DNA helicase DinG